MNIITKEVNVSAHEFFKDWYCPPLHASERAPDSEIRIVELRYRPCELPDGSPGYWLIVLLNDGREVFTRQQTSTIPNTIQ